MNVVRPIFCMMKFKGIRSNSLPWRIEPFIFSSWPSSSAAVLLLLHLIPKGPNEVSRLWPFAVEGPLQGKGIKYQSEVKQDRKIKDLLRASGERRIVVFPWQ